MKATAVRPHRATNRIVDILELVSTSREGLALHEVSAQLEAPKSSLLPLLRALTARGYLAQGRDGDYRLGLRIFELSSAASARRDLAEVARPALVELMRRTGETVFLGTLAGDGLSVVYVDKVESEQIIRYAAGVGPFGLDLRTSCAAFLPSRSIGSTDWAQPVQPVRSAAVSAPATSARVLTGSPPAVPPRTPCR